MSFSTLLEVRKPDEGVVQVVEAAGMLLGIGNTQGCDVDDPFYRGLAPGSIYPVALRALAQEPPSDVLQRLKLLDLASIDDEVAHKVFAKTLTASFATAGNIRKSQELAPPWRGAASASNGVVNLEDASRSLFSGSREDSSSAEVIETTNKHREVGEAIHALKLAVVSVTLRLMEDDARLPLRNRTTAVLVDGSRMSFLALELAGAAWKFGRFVVIHVTGEDHQVDVVADECVNDLDGEGPAGEERGRGEGDNTMCQDEGTERTSAREGYGRWGRQFLYEELRETCLRQLKIPEEFLDLVIRALPPESSGSANDVTQVIEAVLTELEAEVVYLGCYGRRGPRVTQFGRVALWALERTPYQVVLAKKFSPSMVSPSFFTRPKRYVVAVTADDVDVVTRMLDMLLPLVAPRDSVVLVHVIDETIQDGIAKETADVPQVYKSLEMLLSNKRDLSYRVRVEKTERPPEDSTQTAVQRILKVADDEAADFLAIPYDLSRGSDRTVATGCLREARCAIVAIH